LPVAPRTEPDVRDYRIRLPPWVTPPNRTVRASLQPFREVVKIRLQVPSVVLPRFAVDACRCVSLHREIGPAQALHVVHMVKERREPLFPIPLGCLTYALERAGRAGPALCPGRVGLSVFPLASPLSSAASAAVALFGGFAGSMELSDFLCPCIIGVRP